MAETTTSDPESRFLADVAAMRAQGGGQVMVIQGTCDEIDARYRVGLHHAPVKTLLEAVLRVVLAGDCYERVVVCTAVSHQVPEWRVSASDYIGAEPLIWVARGAARSDPLPRPQVSRLPQGSSFASFDPAPLQTITERVLDPALYRNKSFWAQLDGWLHVREKEPAERRIAWVVDLGWLYPREGDNVPPADPRLAQRIRRGLPLPKRSRLDLFVYFGSDQAGVGSRLALPEGIEVGGVHLSFNPDNDRVVRRAQLTASAQPWASSPLQTTVSGDRDNLYHQLQRARVEARRATARPPRDPGRIDFPFWAELDLEPLATDLAEQLVGQEEACQAVLQSLREYQHRCQDALAAGIEPQPGEGAFELPVIGLFGAAGMGKSLMLEILCRNLFGDSRYYESIDVSGKRLDSLLVGPPPPMQGSDVKSPLIQYAERTNGLGLVCFDEFTRFQSSRHDTTVAHEWGAALQVLQSRRFRPANPAFSPPSRDFHLANTLFVFAGNVGRPGEPLPAGFTAMEELGPALQGRIKARIWFRPLERERFAAAAEACIVKAVRQYLDTYRYPRPSAIAVAPAVMETVVARFERGLEGNPPNFRVLDAEVNRLQLRAAVVPWIERGKPDCLEVPEAVLVGGVR